MILDIDPRRSSEGIVLHVIHDTPTGSKKEWLKWGADHAFVHFLKDVLYKIDGDAIAIYPGDYVMSSPRAGAGPRTCLTGLRKRPPTQLERKSCN